MLNIIIFLLRKERFYIFSNKKNKTMISPIEILEISCKFPAASSEKTYFGTYYKFL